jgi:hypothetical protein
MCPQSVSPSSADSLFHVPSSPLYASQSATNSATLPACFVLRLNSPMPMCLPLVRRIHQITEMECGDLSTPHPLLSLVTQHASTGQLDCANNRGLFVVCIVCILYKHIYTYMYTHIGIWNHRCWYSGIIGEGGTFADFSCKI